jgi:hypothetical protein
MLATLRLESPYALAVLPIVGGCKVCQTSRLRHSLPIPAEPYPKTPTSCAVAAGDRVGCEQSEAVAPTAGERASPPAFSTANGPVNPGHSFVFRGDIGLFLTSVDEAQDLVVRHYNTEDIDFCGGNSAEPTAEEQVVLTRHHVTETWLTGILPVYVYRLSEVPPQEVSPQFCVDLVNKWIYRGTHQLLNHDNNLFGDPSPTNAFGWRGQGTVLDRADKKYHYQESFFVVVDWGSDPPRFIREDYQLSIR